MNEEELVNLNMKSVILDKWKSKLSYPFNLKDLEELENIIDYYEEENQSLKKQLTTYQILQSYVASILCENDELQQKYLNAVADYEEQKFNVEELKKQLEDKEKKYIPGEYAKEEFIKEFDENILLKNQQQEFINYLENEKDRLARECSHIYENSLGKTRLVNEDIFNEVDTILSKYKEIIGGNE